MSKGKNPVNFYQSAGGFVYHDGRFLLVYKTLNGEMRKTSLLRHALVEMPAVSAVKIEMIENSVLALNNEFMLTYFIGNTLYDRKYTFKAEILGKQILEEVPILFKDGVIVR